MFGIEYMCGWVGGEFPLQTQQLLDLWPVGGGKDTQILKTCPQEIERAKGYKGPILELHFLMLEELVDSSSVLSMFFHVVLFDPFGFSRRCAQCQVVLEAGPNDLPWPDDAKSKEKGVTVCALCFGCRGLAVWLAFRVATRP